MPPPSPANSLSPQPEFMIQWTLQFPTGRLFVRLSPEWTGSFLHFVICPHVQYLLMFACVIYTYFHMGFVVSFLGKLPGSGSEPDVLLCCISYSDSYLHVFWVVFWGVFWSCILLPLWFHLFFVLSLLIMRCYRLLSPPLLVLTFLSI